MKNGIVSIYLGLANFFVGTTVFPPEPFLIKSCCMSWIRFCDPERALLPIFPVFSLVALLLPELAGEIDLLVLPYRKGDEHVGRVLWLELDWPDAPESGLLLSVKHIWLYEGLSPEITELLFRELNELVKLLTGVEFVRRADEAKHWRLLVVRRAVFLSQVDGETLSAGFLCKSGCFPKSAPTGGTRWMIWLTWDPVWELWAGDELCWDSTAETEGFWAVAK